jgi:integrase
MKNNGKEESYRKSVEHSLKFLAKHADIFNSLSVKEFIANYTKTNGKTKGTKASNGTKRKHINCYDVFCEVNQIPFDKPTYSYQSPIPLIPKASDVEQIISLASKRYAVIFTILSETAVEQTELHKTSNQQINKEQGTISILGTKDHDNGTYKLKDTTAEMLRQYLAHPLTNNDEYPFPNAKTIGETWVRIRKKLADKLCKPEINKIQLKNLRNYAGAVFYTTMGKDPIQTMHFMRHKKLETTMDYLRGLTEFTANAEYISKVATTAEEAIKLLNQGFKEESIFGEKHIFRKLKY